MNSNRDSLDISIVIVNFNTKELLRKMSDGNIVVKGIDEVVQNLYKEFSSLGIAKKNFVRMEIIHPNVLVFKNKNLAAIPAPVPTKQQVKEGIDQKDSLFCQQLVEDNTLFNGDLSVSIDDAFLSSLNALIKERETEIQEIRNSYIKNYKEFSASIEDAWKLFPELIGKITKPIF